MKKIFIDKIASATKNISLEQEEYIKSDIPSFEGTIIAALVLENKLEYNLLELPSGRFSTLKKGDVIAVPLGKRRALKGLVGDIPDLIKVGDTLHILNIGGVTGLCSSENMNAVGKALPVEVLGGIVRDNEVCNIKQNILFKPSSHLRKKIKLIMVSGTCMNVGKTSVVCEILSHAVRNNFTPYATKLAGVACLKDVEKMKDYGAKKTISFLDAGFTSTVSLDHDGVAIAKGAINFLAEGNPDFIIIEFGDGVFGEYGVMNILKDKEISENIAFHIGCAHDPMGATCLVETCSKLGSPIDLISGPVSDNSVGKDFIRKNLGLPAFNALYYNKKLFNYIHQKCLKN